MRRRLLLGLIFLLSMAASGRGATLRVGVSEEFPTIQAAVDSAASGDTLLLAPQTFHESPLIRDKNLVIRSITAQRAILDAGPFAGQQGNGGNGIRSVRSLLTLEDLEICNAQPVPVGAGVLVWGGHVDMRRCVLRNNVFGILSFEPVPGTMRLEDCTLLGNGVGIWGFVSTQVVRTRVEGNWFGVRAVGFAELEDVQVLGNGFQWPWGEPSIASGGLVLVAGVGRVQRVTVQGNHSIAGTSGIWFEGGPYEVSDCVSADNHSEAGPSGIVAVRVTQLTLQSCTSRDNFSRGQYRPVAGLLVDRSRVVARSCRFENNDSGEHGGGVAAVAGSSLEMHGGRIVGNRCRLNGGGLYALDSQVTLDSVAVLGNRAPQGGGAGIAVDPGAQVTVRRSTVAGNVGVIAASLFILEGTVAFEQSIVAFNAGSPTLLCLGDVSWACSDLFGNSDDEPCGRDLGGNLAVNPGFCDFDPARQRYDVRLQEDSPLLQVPGCGWIGAAPLGCRGTRVESVTWGKLKNFFR